MKTKPILSWLFMMLLLIHAATAYTIEKDSVYIDDANVYLSATPHTLEGSGWVVFNVTSKVYSGDVNVVFGVDTEQMNPTRATYWSDAQEKWIDFGKDWSSAYYNLDGKNKWWYLENVPITAGHEYQIAVYLKLTYNATGKYDFGVYPSSYGFDVLDAYNHGHLYYLDPWFNNSWHYCRQWNINETIGVNREMMVVNHNLSGLTFANNATELRIVNGSCIDGGNEIEYSLIDTNDLTWAYVSYWVNISANDSLTYSVYYNNPNASNPLPYDSPPILFEVDFPDGTNTTNKSRPYIFTTGVNYIGAADYFSGTSTAGGTDVNWDLNENYLYYGKIGNLSYDVLNAQIGHRMSVANWRSYIALFPGIVKGTAGFNLFDGYFCSPVHYLASQYSIQEYNQGGINQTITTTSVSDTLNFIHTNYSMFSNGTVIMSTNTSSSVHVHDPTPAMTTFNGTGVRSRSSYGHAHWMKFSTGQLYGVELSDYQLVLGNLSPEIGQDFEIYPMNIYENMVETTTLVVEGWISNNNSASNSTYNITDYFNESCFLTVISPNTFNITGAQNVSWNATFTEYHNCSVGVHTGDFFVYSGDAIVESISVTINVTEDNNTYVPTIFSMTIPQSNFDEYDFNITNPNVHTDSNFTFSDNFDVFCFTRTYIPSTVEVNGNTTIPWTLRIGVNALCPNTTYHGNVTVYDDGFYDFTITGTVIVTNTSAPPQNVTSAGMNCSYSPVPYLRKTIDWVCLLNVSSDWYCYGMIFWNNDGYELVSISPDSSEFEDFGLLDFQSVSGRLLNMQFKNTDLYSDNLYNFTVECVNALENNTAHFSALVTPTFIEPRSLLYRSIWMRDNATYIIVIIMASLVILSFVGYVVWRFRQG